MRAVWLKLLKNTGSHSIMCEILAPAGDKNCAITAINSGADAVYLGLKEFSARSSAGNFDLAQLKEIIDYAAIFGVKVYVALNTMVKQSEVEDFIACALAAWRAGADALILQDMFLGKALKESNPQITLHLSTQAGVCNVYGARLAEEFGFSRVILARETPIEDIIQISKLIETEVFVQGALCTCFSGQCYMSSFAGGNSGNRGRCKQPCRKLYSIDRRDFEKPAYRLSLSDLCVGEDIKKLIDAGVASFKIEGRMRRPEYVAAAVGYYRDILAGNPADISALRRTYNRGNYTRGLAFGQGRGFISSAVQGHIGEYAGIVKVADGRYFCESREKFSEGDGFKILRDGTELCGAAYGGDGRGGFYLRSSKRLKNGDKVFITTDCTLNSGLLQSRRFHGVDVSANFAEGKHPEVIINGFKFIGEEPLLSADKRPLTSEDIVDCFRKTGELPFSVTVKEAVVCGRPYLGMASLNKFRRLAYEAYLEKLTFKGERNTTDIPNMPVCSGAPCAKTAVICTDLNGVKADIGILKPEIYGEDLTKLCSNFTGEKYLYVPAFLSGAEVELIKRAASGFDGIYCESTFGIVLARELKKPLFAGTGFNISNSFGAQMCGAEYYCISKELTLKEAQPLLSDKSFYLSRGGIKVMDLVYCPFGRSCAKCDKRASYTLTDEAGRKFPLRRYETSVCRFELYNCANIFCGGTGGLLADYTGLPAAEFSHIVDEEQLKQKLGLCTRGHSVSPVL